MNVYLTHESALHYWRSRGRTRDSQRQRQTVLPTLSPDSTFIRNRLHGYSIPVDIALATSSARRPSSKVRPHVYSSRLPNNSFCCVGGGLFVSTPEFCFLQMASQLPLVKLIELGFEFCGSYSRACPDRDATYNHQQLTTTTRLLTFVTQMKDVRGHVKAGRALSYVIDNSGSPMETILVMLLTLPYRLGGFGLPKPSLNVKVEPSKSTVKSSDRMYYICDLLWEQKKLAVEYDSEQYHSGAEKIYRDSKRRNLLSVMGYPPIILTKQQLYSMTELEKVVYLLARKLGKQLKHRSSGFAVAHRELRRVLLG